LRDENAVLRNDELPRLRDELAQLKTDAETNSTQLAARKWLEREARESLRRAFAPGVASVQQLVPLMKIG